MFFVSNSLADTLLRTLIDLIYTRNDAIPIILINYVAFKDLTITGVELIKDSKHSISMEIDRSVDDGKTWKINGHKVIFICSYDVPLETVFVFLKEQVTTITHQKQ